MPGVDLPDRVDMDEEADISFRVLRTRMRTEEGQLHFSVLETSRSIILDPKVQEITFDG